MEIPGIESNDPIFGATPDQAADLDKDAFLNLLVAQLKAQDPLSPTANEEMIAQLAQFSSLEQMEDLNDNILGMTVLQQNNALLEQLVSGSALIGKSVEYIDPETGEPSSGEVNSVKVEDGLAVLNIGGQDVPLANVTEVTGDAGTGGSSDSGDSGDSGDSDDSGGGDDSGGSDDSGQ